MKSGMKIKLATRVPMVRRDMASEAKMVSKIFINPDVLLTRGKYGCSSNNERIRRCSSNKQIKQPFSHVSPIAAAGILGLDQSVWTKDIRTTNLVFSILAFRVFSPGV